MTPDPLPQEHVSTIQSYFSRIAPRYERMNSLMTAGQDELWRKIIIRLAAIPKGGLLLDLGAGTGGMSREALRQVPSCHPFAVDLNLEMMRVGQLDRRSRDKLTWCEADALHVPFPDNTFDAVVSGFLLRNVSSLQQALREQYRVLKPGGRMAALDTTRPLQSLFSPLIHFYLGRILPLLGKIATGQADPYRYLGESTKNFLRAEELLVHIASVGFKKPAFHRLMFDTIAIHWAIK